MSKKKLYSKTGIVYSTDSNFKIDKNTEEVITLPVHEQALKVKLDAKHRGGKMVTVIEGYIGTESDLNDLAKLLKSHCATGGSAKNNEIIVQGDNRDKIIQWLNKSGYKRAKKIM